MRNKANQLADQVYERIRKDIFDFLYLPGDHFTETEMAERYAVSRTPVRDALYRLEREGFLEVEFRRGWHVRPFDFDRFAQLYDLRIVLEVAAIRQLCAAAEIPPDISALMAIWSVPVAERLKDGELVCQLDEELHYRLQVASGNREMALVHQEVADKIRIIRRLDFTLPQGIELSYDQHSELLRLIAQRKEAQAVIAIRSHIEESKAEVRKITLHMLYEARQKVQQERQGIVSFPGAGGSDARPAETVPVTPGSVV